MTGDTDTLLKLPDFHPVIFANGEDDDLPGVCAAFLGMPVQYLDRVYGPSENIDIGFKTLFLSKYIAIESEDGATLMVIGNGIGAPHVIRIDKRKIASRVVSFHHCTFYCGGRP